MGPRSLLIFIQLNCVMKFSSARSCTDLEYYDIYCNGTTNANDPLVCDYSNIQEDAMTCNQFPPSNRIYNKLEILNATYIHITTSKNFNSIKLTSCLNVTINISNTSDIKQILLNNTVAKKIHIGRLGELDIIRNSSVKSLRVHLTSGSSAFVRSNIDHIEYLKATQRSALKIENCTIGKITKLVIATTIATIVNSTINEVPQNGIRVMPRTEENAVQLTLKNVEMRSMRKTPISSESNMTLEMVTLGDALNFIQMGANSNISVTNLTYKNIFISCYMNTHNVNFPFEVLQRAETECYLSIVVATITMFCIVIFIVFVLLSLGIMKIEGVCTDYCCRNSKIATRKCTNDVQDNVRKEKSGPADMSTLTPHKENAFYGVDELYADQNLKPIPSQYNVENFYPGRNVDDDLYEDVYTTGTYPVDDIDDIYAEIDNNPKARAQTESRKSSSSETTEIYCLPAPIIEANWDLNASENVAIKDNTVETVDKSDIRIIKKKGSVGNLIKFWSPEEGVQ